MHDGTLDWTSGGGCEAVVDLETGLRSRLKDRLSDDQYLEESPPSGKYLLYFENNQYWTVNTGTLAVVNITKNIKTSFAKSRIRRNRQARSRRSELKDGRRMTARFC